MSIQNAETFLAVEWHDALLLEVFIDRSEPGERDEVLLLLEMRDGARLHCRFSDCYAFDSEMNFGVIAPESIRGVRCITESPKLAEVRQRWSGIGVALEDLKCFEITTNSTASQLRVYARRFELATAEGVSPDQARRPG